MVSLAFLNLPVSLSWFINLLRQQINLVRGKHQQLRKEKWMNDSRWYERFETEFSRKPFERIIRREAGQLQSVCWSADTCCPGQQRWKTWLLRFKPAQSTSGYAQIYEVLDLFFWLHSLSSWNQHAYLHFLSYRELKKEAYEWLGCPIFLVFLPIFFSFIITLPFFIFVVSD